MNFFSLVCHTLATTKLDWCERKDTDVTEDGDLDKQALSIVKDLQTAPKEPKNQVVRILHIKSLSFRIHNT